MVTFSKPLTVVEPQGNSPQELTPIPLIEFPQACKLTKDNYLMYKLCMVPYNTNLPMYDLAVPFYDNRSVEEWLKFCQHLQAVITRQNIMDPQGMYAITKSMLCGDTLTAFENVEGVNGPQSKPAYKLFLEGVHMHMFLLQAYVIQTRYMCWTLMKPHDVSLHTFVASVNKMNDQMEQSSLRDDGTPQVQLTEDKLIDILENAVPKYWQGEIHGQRFDCAAE
eukprot:6991236-Ditylum_brightwellii.AAC.1